MPMLIGEEPLSGNRPLLIRAVQPLAQSAERQLEQRRVALVGKAEQVPNQHHLMIAKGLDLVIQPASVLTPEPPYMVLPLELRVAEVLAGQTNTLNDVGCCRSSSMIDKSKLDFDAMCGPAHLLQQVGLSVRRCWD
jgi:hypothetical protein